MRRFFSLGSMSIIIAVIMVFGLGSISEGEIQVTEDGAYFGGTVNDYYMMKPFEDMWDRGHLLPASEITAAFWMKVSPPAKRYKALISYAIGDGIDANEFLIYDYGNLSIYINHEYIETGISVDADAEWHHIAVTWSTYGGELKVYKDVGMENERIYTGTLARGYEIRNGGALVFGQDQDSPGGGFEGWEAFHGLLKEIAIWIRVLTQEEIEQVKNNTPISVQGGETIVVQKNYLAGYWFWEPTLEIPHMQDGAVHVPAESSVVFKASTLGGLYGNSGHEWTREMSYEWTNPMGKGQDIQDYDGIGRTPDFKFTEPGAKKIYFRAVIGRSSTGTLPLSLPKRIPVYVWNPPVVFDAPPQDYMPGDDNNDGYYSPEEMEREASWLEDKYVGVVGQPIRFVPDGRKRNEDIADMPEEFISRYVWDLGSEGEFDQLLPVPAQFDGTVDKRLIVEWFDMPEEQLTVAFWMQVDTSMANDYGTPISYSALGPWKHNPSNSWQPDEFAILNRQGDKISTQVCIKGNRTDFVEICENDGEWHHVAVTWRSSDGKVTLYSDGIERYTGNLAQGLTISPGGALIFGQMERLYWVMWLEHPFDTAEAFAGMLDDVAIWSTVLEPGEIEAARAGEPQKVKESALVSSFSSMLELIPGSQNPNGGIKCRAVNNYGIEGDEQEFDVRVYAALQLDVPDQFTGRPNKELELQGSIKEIAYYYGGATFEYRWRVEETPGSGILVDVDTDGNGKAFYTWPATGNEQDTYNAEFEATVKTAERLLISGSATTTIIVEAGIPDAVPGGPYTGGIAGGDFSPIQFEANTTYEDLDDQGRPASYGIDEWQWTFYGHKGSCLLFDNSSELQYFSVGSSQEGIANFPATEITAAFWMKLSSAAEGDRVLISYAVGDGADANEFLIYDYRNLSIYINNERIKTGISVNDEKWHHIAVTWRSNDGVLKVYKDVGTGNETIYTGTHATGSTIGNGGVLVLGQDSVFDLARAFNGYMDEIAIWDSVLTDSEIRDIASISIPIGDNRLVGYWSLDDGKGNTATDSSGNVNQGTLSASPPQWVHPSDAEGWNPTHAYSKAGRYSASLCVRSEFGKWSLPVRTRVTVIDGKIKGFVRAADLRTPVPDVTLRLTSDHVDEYALQQIAAADERLHTDSNDGIITTTGSDGVYIFEHLPLGSYRIVASRMDNPKTDHEFSHEFETAVRAADLTLKAPNQLAVDFVDLSVYPVGGKVYYSILKNGKDKVYVEDVMITAQPVGSTSLIEALPSTKVLDANEQNYSLPLFYGKYLFLAKRGGHDIRLMGTQPSDSNKNPIGEPPAGYSVESGLVTIEESRRDIHFIDYTTRKLTVYVEDSGGYPIYTIKQEDGQEVAILAEVNGINGYLKGEVSEEDGKSIFEAIVPPGKYDVSLPNVPDAVDKDNKSNHTATVDLRTTDGSLTMVVPVQIELEVGPSPKILDPDALAELEELLAEYELTLADLGIDEDNNPEGFMYYIPDPEQTQRHTYSITATANGKAVKDFKLKISDNISMFSKGDAPEKQYPDYSDERYDDGKRDEEDNQLVEMEYTVLGGLPNMTTPVFDPAGNETELPKALPKTIKFQAEKDGYKPSEVETREVTVLGDVPLGSASELVAIPNVNYFVLHDPPGDGSYSFIDDTIKLKGIVVGMKIRPKYNLFTGGDIPVYPSPWSEERQIVSGFFDQVDFDEIAKNEKDLGKDGLLEQERFVIPANAAFAVGTIVETVKGAVMVASGRIGLAVGLQLVSFRAMEVFMSSGPSDLIPELQSIGIVQYEISPSRHLETPSGDSVADAMGPGKGDVYYGEGMTVALQTKYRLGIKQNPDFEEGGPNYDPEKEEDKPARWLPDTEKISTYAAVPQGNQYSYTVRDINSIIHDLTEQIALLDPDDPKKGELEEYRGTWDKLLKKNPAYVWQSDHVKGDNSSDRQALDAFLAAKKSKGQLAGDGELLMFSAGTSYEYSRTIHQSQTLNYSTQLSASTSAGFGGSLDFEVGTFVGLGAGAIILTGKMGSGGTLSYDSSQNLGVSLESGVEAEQTVGFVLNDDDIGDRISTYVYEGPWGTPIFFTDPGSITSDPWEPNTNKGVDVSINLVEEPASILPFDYHGGAHYKLRISYDGKRDLDSIFSTIDFLLYAPPPDNIGGLTVRFNGKAQPYTVGLTREAPTAEIALSLYPPEIDMSNSEQKEYQVVIQAQEAADPQISRLLPFEGRLKVNFADRRAPRAVVTAPYAGQRISPAVFTVDEPFQIQVFSDDQDLGRIQLKRRSKLSNGVWGSWDTSDMPAWPGVFLFYTNETEYQSDLDNESIPVDLQQDFQDNGISLSLNTTVSVLLEGSSWLIKDKDEDNEKTYLIRQGEDRLNIYDSSGVSIVTYKDRYPVRREFTFNWSGTEIARFGEGEYAICAVAEDRATRLRTDGTQELKPNVDLDPPVVTFVVDGSKPSVLTTVPDYQARESERIYRGELSVTFTDDMQADSINSDTFVVKNLEIPAAPSVAGFISYSPALRKVIFVPVQPFKPNDFYHVTVKTDTETGQVDANGNPVIERGVRDLAGNPLDNTLSWTFRTPDSPFEPTWSITLKAINTDGQGNVLEVDANNIAGVEYGALDGEDEKDARSVPPIDTQISLSFLNDYKEKFDRDIHPADGRLSHHWFFVIGNAKAGKVTIRYKPSVKLTRSERQYQILKLVEFSVDGSGNISVSNVIPLDPTGTDIDSITGDILELEAYSYDVAQDGDTRYFRLDVQKANLVATQFQVGTSGWKFFSVPITPEQADPFVNLGDDMDPFQMYKYDTETGGYKIYPLDLGEVTLETGHGYFTRLNCDVEVDVDVGGTYNMSDMTLELEAEGWHAIGNPFPKEVKVEDLTVNSDLSFNEAIINELVEGTLYRWKTDGSGDTYEAVDQSSQLLPWEGYWIKTKEDNVTLTIPAPSGLNDAYTILPDSYKPPAMAPPAVDSRRIAVQPGEFDLRLELTSNSSADTTTTLGTRQKARMDWDPMDQSEPPILGETVAAYFHHPDWGDDSGSYNRDYQPVLNAGEERTWRVTVYTDKPDSQMKLSWEESISQVPDDVMIYFRRADTGADDDWQDMRKVRSMDLESRLQFTSIPIEISAQRYEMRPPSGVQVTPGEKLVALRWEPDDNEFIDGYIITRQDGSAEDWRDGEGVSYTINNVSEFVDRDVLEEVTYTYQLRVRFMSGAELGSQLFTVRTLPIIKQTALMRCYPNPFNPEVWIPYDLAEEASVSIEIYSVSGQLVRTLDLGVQQRGRYASRGKAAYWDGLNQAGEKSASGVYFYVLRAGKYSASKKMALVR